MKGMSCVAVAPSVPGFYVLTGTANSKAAQCVMDSKNPIVAGAAGGTGRVMGTEAVEPDRYARLLRKAT